MKDSGVAWIGEVPEGWKAIRLRYLCDITTGDHDTQDAEPDGEYPFYVRSPVVERSSTYTFDGDGVLMAGDGAGAGRVFHEAKGRYAVHQRVYRMHNFRAVLMHYFWYYVSIAFPRVMDMGSAQSTVPSVRLPMLENLEFFLPSLCEQSKIAAYLDRECGKIDALVAKTEQQIAALEEYKKSVITEAVTGKWEKGPKKDSGVEWIGDVPNDWQIKRLKYVADVARGGSPRPIEDYMSDDGTGYNWIKIGDTIKGCKYIDSVREKIIPAGLSKTRQVKCGDLLLTNSMSFGEAYILNVDGCIHDGWVCLSPKDCIVKEFLYYQLLSEAVLAQFGYSVDGGVVQNLNTDKIGCVRITFPEKSQQLRIVARIDDMCLKIDTTKASLEKQFDELTSYKKSLIFECVTGKREVA